MDKKELKQLTTKIYEEYGFVKRGKYYYLDLEDVVICSGFSSMYGIPYLAYNFSIKAIHPEEERKPNNMFDGYDSFANEICFNTKAPGTHGCEIEFETWEKDYYADKLRKSLHYYFDPYKEDALNHIRRLHYEIGLVHMGTIITVSKAAREYLGVVDGSIGNVKAGNFKITGTYQYGKLLGMGLFVAFNILLGLGVLSLGVMLFAPIDNYGVYIIELALCLAVWGVWIWLTVIQIRQRKHIKLWMQDAILAEGLMRNTADMPGSPIRKHTYQITVKFQKNKSVLESRSFYTKGLNGFVAVKYYNKHLDRKIPVLYSPKYNQVIFIQLPERYDPID